MVWWLVCSLSPRKYDVFFCYKVLYISALACALIEVDKTISSLAILRLWRTSHNMLDFIAKQPMKWSVSTLYCHSLQHISDGLSLWTCLLVSLPSPSWVSRYAHIMFGRKQKFSKLMLYEISNIVSHITFPSYLILHIVLATPSKSDCGDWAKNKSGVLYAIAVFQLWCWCVLVILDRILRIIYLSVLPRLIG